MKSFQALRSPAIPLTSFHNLLVLLISSSVALRQVLFGLPLLLYPWGFQSNADFSIAPVSLRNVCPIQFHFLLFIWFSIDFWWVILHSSSFVILSVHFIFIIRLKHLFTNICSHLVIWLVVFHVSQAHDNNFTYLFWNRLSIISKFALKHYALFVYLNSYCFSFSSRKRSQPCTDTYWHVLTRTDTYSSLLPEISDTYSSLLPEISDTYSSLLSEISDTYSSLLPEIRTRHSYLLYTGQLKK